MIFIFLGSVIVHLDESIVFLSQAYVRQMSHFYELHHEWINTLHMILKKILP